MIASLSIGVFSGAILGLFSLESALGHFFESVLLTCITVGGILLLVIRLLRCPVCHNVFVGKQEPTLFTEKCRYCGRRSGDTG